MRGSSDGGDDVVGTLQKADGVGICGIGWTNDPLRHSLYEEIDFE